MAGLLKVAGAGGATGFALAFALQSASAGIWVATAAFVMLQVVGFWMEPAK